MRRPAAPAWLFLVLAATGCPPAAIEIAHEAQAADYSQFWPSKSCNNCHERLFTQYRSSAHAASFLNPVFQAQLYGQILPRVGTEPGLKKEAASCLACHSPITFLQHRGEIVPAEQVEPGLSGVTCDFCHTVRGYVGASPGDANYISEPGELKGGPFKETSDWHHAYSALMTKSEFCATCHTAHNGHGVPLRTTYEEWQSSSYAKRGVQCQDCHMSAKGFLVGGEAQFEAGRVAQMTVGTSPEAREKLFSHRFPGAHTSRQVAGAMGVRVVPRPAPLKAGEAIQVEVVVENTNVGHRMPSGSAELRAVWLEVRVGFSDEDPGVLLAASPRMTDRPPFDVVGASPLEHHLLRQDAPAGSRVYRAVFADEAGVPTLTNHEARTLLFDDRLEASESRHELYDFVVPKTFVPGTDLHVAVTLNYLRFPSLFADGLGQAHAEVTTIATGSGIVGSPEEKDER